MYEEKKLTKKIDLLPKGSTSKFYIKTADKYRNDTRPTMYILSSSWRQQTIIDVIDWRHVIIKSWRQLAFIQYLRHVFQRNYILFFLYKIQPKYKSKIIVLNYQKQIN